MSHVPLTNYVKLRVAHAPGMPGTFSPAADFKRNRQLATPACITARAWRTTRDVCRDRLPGVAGKTFPAFPAHAHPQFYVSDAHRHPPCMLYYIYSPSFCCFRHGDLGAEWDPAPALDMWGDFSGCQQPGSHERCGSQVRTRPQQPGLPVRMYHSVHSIGAYTSPAWPETSIPPFHCLPWG